MGQMNPTILLFAILAIVKLRRSAESALLDVFLPVLLLVPFSYSLRIPHLPPLSCVDAVLFPIGIAALISRSSRWRFQRADLWVILFVLAFAYTDYINIGIVSAVFNFPSYFCDALFAYFAGKLLVEQGGIREQFVRRMVVLLAATGLISIVEFIGKRDMFLLIARVVFFSHPYESNQIRGGFMRVKGPFFGAEQAGIMFMIGFSLSLWLWFLYRLRQGASEPKHLGLRRSTLWVCCILLGLYMTLSRGPWLGTATAFLIARIGLVRNRRLAMVVALIFIAVGTFLYNLKARQFSQLDAQGGDLTEEQSSAEYRTHLFDDYEPVAERGGLFGWSGTAYPRLPGRDSIDNQYLFLWVANGKVGLTLFIVIAAEGALAIVLAIRRSRQPIDTCFYYCLGGSLAGLMVVLGTVYLTGQAFLLFFLFIGWTQSLRDQFGTDKKLPEKSASRFAFRRVFA